MVGRVLTQNRGITRKDHNQYWLNGFSDLDQNQINKLIELCEGKITEFITKRGDSFWVEEEKSFASLSKDTNALSGIPGQLRYDVLKRAKSKCELCGVSARKKSLDVGYIILPGNGGSGNLANLQALCQSCNMAWRDEGDTDFRSVADTYSHRQSGCVFCEMQKRDIIDQNELAFAIRDRYPVTKFHTLIIPKRHVSDYFDLYQPERNAIQQLLENQRTQILEQDERASGFNIGHNVGEDAGQTVFHCHTHLIPRRMGDVINPKGGIRGVLPGKQAY